MIRNLLKIKPQVLFCDRLSLNDYLYKSSNKVHDKVIQ